VQPVNDAPSFDAIGPNVFHFAGDTSTYIYPGWSEQISAGPQNESHQSLTFEISYLEGNAQFFDVDPVVDVVTGDLSFNVENDVDGQVILLIKLKDDGGTDYGGIDMSTGVQVTITHSTTDIIFKNSFESSIGS
jgi:hypothetical protein